MIRERKRSLSPVSLLPALGALVLLAGCGQEEKHQLDAHIVSSPAAFVSGGDMLIEGLPDGIALTVEDRSLRGERRGLLTYVQGLPEGTHEIVGHVDLKEVLRLRFTNYPRQGPVIAGPHETPYFCETQAFDIGPGAGTLGPSTPPVCFVPARNDGFMSDDVGYHWTDRDDPAVSVETGVVNRAVYQIAMPRDWNGKLVYRFGGGCRGGWYRQGDRTGGVLEPHLLGRGYAVASASLNVFGVNCNDLLAAETMMMVKERFIEQHGVPRFTIGYGCSGGSYQAHQIGDNYPGLLDGILVGCSFPEVGHAMVSVLADARLLKRYFDWANAETDVRWSDAEKIAVTGFASEAALTRTAQGASRIVAVELEGWNSAEFADVVPVGKRFDPLENPTGARPTVFDHTINVYGADPDTGYARWPFDNRGIQYGLSAFRGGAITAEQFLHLNRYVGGYTRNGEFSAERTAHDIEATRAAYASGRILDGGGGLNEIPIIDYRAWADARETGDTHLEYHTYSTRARLRAANGDIDNHVVLTEDGLCEGCSLFSLESPVLSGALDGLDEWLSAIEDDTLEYGNRADKVRRNRPANLVDACWIDGEKVAEPQTVDGGRCNEAFPTGKFPRYVAGAPIENNIVACSRRAVDANDLRGLKAAGQRVFRDVFNDGVCDWSKPGEGQTRLSRTWWRVEAPTRDQRASRNPAGDR